MSFTQSLKPPVFKDVTFIYFDLDDTLVDHKKAQDSALLDVWTQYPQLQKVQPVHLIELYGQINEQLWDAYRKGKTDRPTMKRQRFEQTLSELEMTFLDWREVEAIYKDCYRRHWEWIDDAREGFIHLSGKYPVGVMTNGFTDVQQQKFEYFSLHRYARHLIISEEAGYLKPDPRIFNYSAQMAKCEPGQLLYVGDSHSTDILGARQCGWKAAWYNRNGAESPSPTANLTFNYFSQLVEALS